MKKPLPKFADLQGTHCYGCGYTLDYTMRLRPEIARVGCSANTKLVYAGTDGGFIVHVICHICGCRHHVQTWKNSYGTPFQQQAEEEVNQLLGEPNG